MNQHLAVKTPQCIVMKILNKVSIQVFSCFALCHISFASE